MSQIHLEHAHMRIPSGFDHMEASRVSMHASRCVPVTRMGAHDACAWLISRWQRRCALEALL